MRSFLVAFATAPAADDRKLTPQQEKMKSGNADASAKALKGERKGALATRA